ncbi:GxxExxY protein [Halosquirtibacter xylanolyticus]|uniref:GxxExxY protein n=1 Tax=Halosquirtibacter xylanolyticus TaxID=3374599 RepID=UPI00374906D9|nr:GxxExxY protein [Prolixibacteraceae bacterium]
MYFDLTQKIIKCYYEVYNTLGFGFLEQVYEKALLYELKSSGLYVEDQKKIEVFYQKQNVGVYYADLVVENKVIIELKAVKRLTPEFSAQLLNYLKATNFDVGLLMNFGVEPEFKRLICDF